jgi:hypothetical protein
MTASSSRWVVLTFALLVPATARAEPPNVPPSEEQIEAARAIYKEAREFYRQGKLKEALEKAVEAYRTASTPVTALEAGQLLVESGRIVEARDMLRGVAQMPVSPRESDKGRESRQQASMLATSLDARIPKLAVAGRPRGVDILLDGKPLGAAEPSAWQGVDPGAHTLVVRAEERTCSTITVTLAEGEVRTIDLHDVASSCHVEQVPPEPPRSAPPPRPQPPRPPPPSTEAPAPPPPAEAEHGTSAWKWAGLAIGGLGVAAVGIGGYLALAAKSDYESVSDQCTPNGCTRTAFNVRNDARSQADIATVVMSVGGVAAVGGLIMWLVAPDSGSGHSSDVGRPHLSVGVASVGVTVPLR